MELIDFLHERGVITVGIDTPSVDLFESKELPAHKAIYDTICRSWKVLSPRTCRKEYTS